jgi:hypothetical protein
MTRKQAEPLWEQAKRDADIVLNKLEKEGQIDFENTTEDEMARLCLHEALVLALSPLRDEIKNRALRIVLDWCKPKPATATDLEVRTEKWLREIIDDHKASLDG